MARDAGAWTTTATAGPALLVPPPPAAVFDDVTALSFEAVRAFAATFAVPRFACSTIPARDAEMADVAAEAAFFRGEFGRPKGKYEWVVLVGDAGSSFSLIGERGSVREL